MANDAGQQPVTHEDGRQPGSIEESHSANLLKAALPGSYSVRLKIDNGRRNVEHRTW